MKKFLIAGSCVGAVAAAGSAGALDVTLGGSIDMSMDFGVGKGAGGLGFDPASAAAAITLSLSAAGTTDAGLKYGGSFAIGTVDEIELDLYDGKKIFKYVNEGRTDLTGKVYNVSGGKSITANSIVSVKINSGWIGIGEDFTAYGVTMMVSGDAGGVMPNSAICKIAGRYTSNLVASGVAANDIGNDDVISGNYTNEVVASARDAAPAFAIAPAADTAYLPAGRLTDNAQAAITHPNSADTQNMAIGLNAGEIDFIDGNAVDGAPAAVYMGPFMDVKIASSETKHVVGRVCIDGMVASDTVAYINNASKVVTASGASVFVSGGFGKLTLSTSDYDGKVAAIGEAGDAASVENSGMTLSAESLSMMGFDMYGAVSLGSITDNSRPNWMLGTSGTFGGLSVMVEVEDETTTTAIVDNWDIGLSYAMGDVELNAAIDDDRDWGVSAEMGISGVDVVLSSHYNTGDHEKSGIIISGSVGTTINGLGLSVSFDQDLDYGLSLSYALGIDGLALSAGYASADEGGSIGATLSF